jgi:hypothetical protein
VQLGAYIEYQLEAESRIVHQKLLGDEIFSTRELSFPVRKNQVGFTGGIGLVKPFNRFTGSLVLRYARVSTPNQVVGVVHNGQQFSLSFILLKR